MIGRILRHLAAQVIGPESVYPETAHAAVTEAIAAAGNTETDHLLNVLDSIQRCAAAAADAVLVRSPELDRDSLASVFEQELWMAVADISGLSRSGALS